MNNKNKKFTYTKGFILTDDQIANIDKSSLTPSFIAKYREGKFNQSENNINTDTILAETKKIIKKIYRKPLTIDPFPAVFTNDNLTMANKLFNLLPAFSPGTEILKEICENKWSTKGNGQWLTRYDDPFQGSKRKSGELFWEEDERIALNHDNFSRKVITQNWTRGWYLYDATDLSSIRIKRKSLLSVFPKDKLAPLLAELRRIGEIDRYENTPLGTRQSILINAEWRKILTGQETILPFLKTGKGSLLSYSAFYLIGHMYDKNLLHAHTTTYFSEITRGFLGLWRRASVGPNRYCPMEIRMSATDSLRPQGICRLAWGWTS